MTKLVKYDAARTALAAARSVDEVKDIRDKAEAMRAYARMANDCELEIDAAELRLRAERRLGELLRDMEKNTGTRGRGRPTLGATKTEAPKDPPPKLSDLGIDYKLSSRAQKIAAIPEPAFEAANTRIRERIIARHGKVSLDITAADKKERRAQREAELAAKQEALPEKKFGVIVADPPWRFEPWSRESGMDRAADNHYPTACAEVIAALDVPSIAAEDCVLFLWATAPMLPQALLVMAAWGFGYRSHYIWMKDRIGTGYWGRNQHELLLIGTRGDVPAPAPGEQRASVIEGRGGRHSAKPDVFLEMIEEYFPNLPKIELNRRGPARPGWAAWGNEVEVADAFPPNAASGPAPAEAPAVVPSAMAAGAGVPLRGSA